MMQSDFLGLELVRGRVRLAWDAGAGVTSITHDLPIEPAAGKKEIDQWYQVKVQRWADKD